MGSSAAFQLGWNTVAQEQAAKRQRKEALEDESRQLKLKDLHEVRTGILAKITALGDTPENPAEALVHQQKVGALKVQLGDVQTQWNDMLDPVKQPGALQRHWPFIKSLITRKPLEPSVATTPTSDITTLAPAPTAAAPLSALPAEQVVPPAGTLATPAVSKTKALPPGIGTDVSPINPYKNPEDQPPEASFAFNQSWAKPGPYITKLTPQQEAAFQVWADANPTLVAGELGPDADYDVRGHWLAAQQGDPLAKLTPNPFDGKLHSSDKWKTPYSGSFSNESIYAAPHAPRWVGGKLMTSDGKLVADETPTAPSAIPQPTAGAPEAPPGPISRPSAALTAPGGPQVRGPVLTPQQRTAQARQQRVQKQVEQLLAGTTTPEDTEVQKAAADVRANKIKVAGLMAQFDELYPNATKEQREEAQRMVFQNVAGFKSSMLGAKWVYKTGKINGQPVTVRYNEKDPSGGLQYASGAAVPEDLAAGFVVDSGRGAKGLTYVKASDSVKDQDTGKPYFRNDPTNPPDVQKLFAGFDRADAASKAAASQLARERGEGYNDSRPVNVIDTTTGASTSVHFSDFMKEPNRYIVASEYDKWSPRVNMLEDLRGSSRIVRDSINTLKAEGGFDFEGDVRTAIFKAMSDAHPKTAIDQLVATGSLAGLSQDQQKYVMATASMIEQAMGMRTILGAGQGSDDVRNAIVATIPSLLTPSPEFALGQMDMFDGTLERVHRMIPSNIKLTYNLGEAPWTVQDKPSPYSEIEPGGGARPARRGGAQGGAAGAKGGRSISKVKAFMQSSPQWKGQTVTDQMATDYILSHNYTPTSP